MGKIKKETQGKRFREHAQRLKRQEKEMRREQRKAQAAAEPRLVNDGEDPDLIGLLIRPAGDEGLADDHALRRPLDGPHRIPFLQDPRLELLLLLRRACHMRP